MRFTGEHKDTFGVEPVCRVLSEHGWKIAPGTYYAARKRPSAEHEAAWYAAAGNQKNQKNDEEAA